MTSNFICIYDNVGLRKNKFVKKMSWLSCKREANPIHNKPTPVNDHVRFCSWIKYPSLHHIDVYIVAWKKKPREIVMLSSHINYNIDYLYNSIAITKKQIAVVLFQYIQYIRKRRPRPRHGVRVWNSRENRDSPYHWRNACNWRVCFPRTLNGTDKTFEMHRCLITPLLVGNHKE